MINSINCYSCKSDVPIEMQGYYAARSGPQGLCDSGEQAKSESLSDQVSLSQEGKLLAALNKSEDENGSGAKVKNLEEKKPSGEEMTEEEKEEAEKLKQRDREVRAHEQAHLSAAGNLAAGGASYQFKTGPDGQQYAVGGEVPLKVQDSKDPQEDLRNAQRLERAALAPAEPSSSDRTIAAKARSKASQAQQEISKSRTKEIEGGEGEQKPEGIEKLNPAAEAGQIGIGEASESENNPTPTVSVVDAIYGAGGISFDRGENNQVDFTA